MPSEHVVPASLVVVCPSVQTAASIHDVSQQPTGAVVAALEAVIDLERAGAGTHVRVLDLADTRALGGNLVSDQPVEVKVRVRLASREVLLRLHARVPPGGSFVDAARRLPPAQLGALAGDPRTLLARVAHFGCAVVTFAFLGRARTNCHAGFPWPRSGLAQGQGANLGLRGHALSPSAPSSSRT